MQWRKATVNPSLGRFAGEVRAIGNQGGIAAFRGRGKRKGNKPRFPSVGDRADVVDQGESWGATGPELRAIAQRLKSI